MRKHALVSLALLSTTFATTSPPAVGASPAAVSYYSGKSDVFLPDGTPTGSSQSLIQRKVHAAENLIIERVVSIDPRPTVKPREFIAIMRVDGSKFDMVELNDAFHGNGELTGASGSWTAWKSHSIMPDGGTLDSSDTLTSSGLRVEKNYFNAAGKLVATMRESHASIGEAEYKDRYAKLFAQQ
jgi:hypothetical protein